MLAYVLADALIEKIGGDSISEMKPRFESLRQGRLEDLPMDNANMSGGARRLKRDETHLPVWAAWLR